MLRTSCLRKRRRKPRFLRAIDSINGQVRSGGAGVNAAVFRVGERNEYVSTLLSSDPNLAQLRVTARSAGLSGTRPDTSIFR
jgi:hypothetical protein